MSKIELAPQILKSWGYAKALGLGETFSGPVALKPSDKFRAIATDADATYEDVYLTGLSEGQHNIMLTDFSFLQFGAAENESVRYAYYPNPFLGAAAESVSELQEMREYVDEGVIDFEEFLHRVAEIRKSQHPPLVRYEYSKEQYVEATHPCSHLHLGFHSENRWPVRRHLTAQAFSLLVFRIFYLDFWTKAKPIKIGKTELSLDTILETARSECRMLYSEEFSESEATRFHFI